MVKNSPHFTLMHAHLFLIPVLALFSLAPAPHALFPVPISVHILTSPLPSGLMFILPVARRSTKGLHLGIP